MTTYRIFLNPTREKSFATYDDERKLWTSPDQNSIVLEKAMVCAELLERYLRYGVLDKQAQPLTEKPTLYAIANLSQANRRLAKTLGNLAVETLVHYEHGKYQWLPKVEVFIEQCAEEVQLETQSNLADLFMEIGEGLTHGSAQYVKRNIEAELEKWVMAEEPALCVIEGDAGNGKTTLCQHLFRSLRKETGRTVWFIRSHVLTLGGREGVLSAEGLLKAQSAVLARSQKLFILFDTVDLVIHDMQMASDFHNLIQALRVRPCHLLMTTRVEEGRQLLIHRPWLLKLQTFDTAELAEAIEKYSAHYYREYNPDDILQYVEDVKSAVTQGEPLLEICEKPLTLRMLFELYAPNAIPSELRVLDLFRTYWDHRVCQDRRAGAILSEYRTRQPAAATNCETTAMSLALAMLANGEPNLGEVQVNTVLKNFGGDRDQVEELIRRGVLERKKLSHPSELCFFHQTFFEHAAAMGMMARIKTQSFSLLTERVREGGFDFFVNPILEQACLLADQGPLAEPAASNAIARLELDQAHQISVAYIYAHLVKPSARLCSVFSQGLNRFEPPVVKRYLEALVNTSINRREDVFTDLMVIWDRRNWNLRSAILRLLRKMPLAYTERIFAFFRERPIIDDSWERSSGGTIMGLEFVPPLLARLEKANAPWCWTIWLEILNMQEKQNTLASLVQVMEHLRKDPAIYQQDQIASQLAETLADTDLQSLQNDAVIKEYGYLWCYQWRLSALTVEEILASLSTNPKIYLAQLRGLYYWFHRDEEALNKILAYFLALTREELRAYWVQGFWQELIPEILVAPSTAYTSSPFGSIRQCIIKVFQDSLSELNLEANNLAELFSKSIYKANVKPDLVSLLFAQFGSKELSIAETRDRPLILLAGKAALGGNPLAKELVLKLVERTDRRAEKIFNDFYRTGIEGGFDFALTVAREQRNVRALGQIVEAWDPEAWKNQRNYLFNLALREANKIDKRYYALKLIRALSDKLSDLQIDAERLRPYTLDTQQIGAATETLEIAALQVRHWGLNGLAEFLEAPLHHPHAAISNSAAKSYCMGLIQAFDLTPDKVRPFVDRLSGQVLALRESKESLLEFAALLKKYTKINPVHCFTLLRNVLRQLPELGIQKKMRKGLGHRLAKVLGVLKPSLSLEDRIELLDLLERQYAGTFAYDKDLAYPIVINLSFAREPAQLDRLAQLHSSPLVHPEVRDWLTTFKFHTSRPNFSKNWPELWQLAALNPA